MKVETVADEGRDGCRRKSRQLQTKVEMAGDKSHIMMAADEGRDEDCDGCGQRL